jgi:hypothetical protein
MDFPSVAENTPILMTLIERCRASGRQLLCMFSATGVMAHPRALADGGPAQPA